MRWSRAGSALVVAFLLGGGVAPHTMACGPYLPDWLLGPTLLEAPVAPFRDELARLGGATPSGFQAVQVGDGRWDYSATAEADVADFAEMLSAAGIAEPERAARVGEYRDLRWMLQGAAAARQARREGAEAPGSGPPPQVVLRVPEHIPDELRWYLQGAAAYYAEAFDEARGKWRDVLDLPPERRRYRSTWAAFMLGKLALETGAPEEAVAWLAKSRELAAAGFVDRSGLAASSFEWEGEAWTRLGRYDQAIVAYYNLHGSGYDNQFTRQLLALACAGAADAGVEALGAVAASPLARRVLTAYLVSPGAGWSAARAWAEALARADLSEIEGADRLAWVAYRGGQMDLATSLVGRARPDSPIARWVRGKLLMRAGKLSQARALLDDVASGIVGVPAPSRWWDVEEGWADAGLATPQRARGEAGAVSLAQGDYRGALDRLTGAGYWYDAAYLAERVLRLDELRDYVARSAPEDLILRTAPPRVRDEHVGASRPLSGYGAENLFSYGVRDPAPGVVALRLRYLLARRLARAGRLEEAMPYYPQPLRRHVDALHAALEAGRDRTRTAVDRGRALFQAACIYRHEGMELLGTELGPDWAVEGGSFDLGPLDKALSRGPNPALQATPDERARVERSRVKPSERFHYRYVAADVAWAAAKLLPDNDDETVEVLATAGNWLAWRDPQAAARFYKALVRRGRRTELGAAADDLRWFPRMDACADKMGGR